MVTTSIEVLATSREGQLRILSTPVAIAEIQGLVGRRNENMRGKAHLRQDLTAVSEGLDRCNAQRRLLATTDPLTGATNRSELERSPTQVTERAQACSIPLTCLAFSAQGLRPINRFHGRQKGDEVMQQLIADVKPLLHANDELFRIGGSEFLLFLWDHRLESARSTLAMSAGVSLLGASDTT